MEPKDGSIPVEVIAVGNDIIMLEVRMIIKAFLDGYRSGELFRRRNCILYRRSETN